MNRLATTLPANFGFDVPRFLSAYASVGCTHIQLYRDPDKALDLENIIGHVRDAGLCFDSIHGLFGPHLDPSSPDDALRKESLDVYERECELVLAIGGTGIVVHPSWKSGDNSPANGSELSARTNALAHSLEWLAECAQRLNVVYYIENLPAPYSIGSDSRALAAQVRRLNAPGLRMCFDTGHAHMQAQAQGDVADQLHDCIDVVGYVHVNDNDGSRDAHLMPGEGTIDWDRVGAVLRQHGKVELSCMLEIFYKEERVEALAKCGLAQRLVRAVGRD